MADLVPATGPALPLPLDRIRAFSGQPGVKRMIPWLIGASALGAATLAWSTLAPGTQRPLYARLDDGDRAGVVASLDQAAIAYDIDPATGALSVDERDFYRARMLVASDGALASPQSGSEMLDSLPMGASRTLEGERLRAARERDLTLTIAEIDGVDSVRVHLAEPEKSAFVRDTVAPSASIMVRMAQGRQLSQAQVAAIVNLVAGSVPGMAADAVRVADQHGRLLSDAASVDGDRLELQSRIEQKLRGQIAQLLTPMLGSGNFSSEIQIELDLDERTSASERYDKDGVIRSETQAQSQAAAMAPAVGVPGVLANTPPPPTAAIAAPPLASAQVPPPGASQPPQVNGESSSSRTFEHSREVAVANAAPGSVKRLSVAVAISKTALKGAKKADIDEITRLVSAAVGANAQRGDQVAVVARKFDTVVDVAPAFYESGWFATLVRYGAALLAVALVLVIGIRPLVKALRRDSPSANAEGVVVDVPGNVAHSPGLTTDPALLGEKVMLAKRLAGEQPDRAVAVLRQMLGEPQAGSPETGRAS